jgi:hypothetical protein
VDEDMRQTHFVLWFSAFIVYSIPVAAQTIPEDVAKAIKEANTEIIKAQHEARSGVASEESKLLKALKKLQDQFTKNAKLDEAVAIRDLLKSVGNVKNSDERRSLLSAGTILVPEEAETVINEYLNKTEGGEKELALLLERLEKAKREKLKPLFDKYTAAGDLDTAIAIRDAMKVVSAELIIADVTVQRNSRLPKALQVLPLSKDAVSARREHQEQFAKQTTWLEEQSAEVMRELLLTLERLQEKETKAGKLDDAVKLRDSIAKFKAITGSVGQVQTVRESRKTLPASSQDAVDEALKAFGEFENTCGEARKKLDNGLAKVIEADVIKTMLSSPDNFEKCLSTAREYYHLKHDSLGLHQVSHGQELISDCEAAKDGLEKVAELLLNKTAEVSEAEGKLRTILVAKLNRLMEDPQMTAAQKDAIGKVEEFANADYSQGPLGMTLFPRSPDLPESARVALAETRTEVRSVMDAARIDLENAWKKLAEDLRPVLKQLIVEGKFATAVQVMRQLQISPPMEFSIPIKFNRIAHSDHCWDATLVDVRGENCFKVNTGGETREWLPRSRIKFHPDDKVLVANHSNGEKPAGPGIPIAPGMKLKKGQKAFKYWGHSWLPVTIQAVTPEGISFTRDGWSRSEEVAARTEILLLED